MKAIRYIFFIAVFSFLGCSPSDDATPPEEEVIIPPVETFNFSAGGELVTVGGLGASEVRKLENMIVMTSILGKFELSFDISGKLGYLKYEVPMSEGSQLIYRKFYTYKDFNSNYFDFNVTVDEASMRVKGSFSGYLYTDSDLNLESKFVSGDFDLSYRNDIPAIFGLKNQAKLNGNLWTSTNKYLTKDPLHHNDITQHDVNEDAYKIMVKYRRDVIQPGTYNFSDADLTNKVQLAKFDPTSATYTIYNCSGVLNITQKETFTYDGRYILAGNYSFTAVNPLDPTDIIMVTDGIFKLIYTGI